MGNQASMQGDFEDLHYEDIGNNNIADIDAKSVTASSTTTNAKKKSRRRLSIRKLASRKSKAKQMNAAKQIPVDVPTSTKKLLAVSQQGNENQQVELLYSPPAKSKSTSRKMQSTNAVVDSSPPPREVLLDPRSPSMQFKRTPLKEIAQETKKAISAQKIDRFMSDESTHLLTASDCLSSVSSSYKSCKSSAASSYDSTGLTLRNKTLEKEDMLLPTPPRPALATKTPQKDDLLFSPPRFVSPNSLKNQQTQQGKALFSPAAGDKENMGMELDFDEEDDLLPSRRQRLLLGSLFRGPSRGTAGGAYALSQIRQNRKVLRF